MPSIEAIEDIGVRHQARLKAADLRSCRSLLEAGATKRGRKVISETVGVAENRVLEWIHKADMMRVNGISTQYSELLEAAGIDSIRKLRRSRSAQLHKALANANDSHRKPLVKRMPSQNQLSDWIRQAKGLPHIVK
jgi:hypothetical protein